MQISCQAAKLLTSPTAKTYPPKTDASLKQFHQAVCDANIAAHHKLSLFYYVLLDFDLANGARSASERFAMKAGMPSNYKLVMNGLWHMDREEFEVRPNAVDRRLLALLTTLLVCSRLRFPAEPRIRFCRRYSHHTRPTRPRRRLQPTAVLLLYRAAHPQNQRFARAAV